MTPRWTEGLDQVDSARLVDLLERLHREGVEVTPELAAEEVSRLGDQRSREGLYAAALEYFSKEERRLKVQSEVTGGLLRKLRERQGGGTQQRLLRLAGEAAAPLRGRFRVENESGGEATITFQPRFEEACRFDPESLRLTAGQSSLVSLSFETGVSSSRELLVDVLANSVVRMKLWVELKVDAS